MNKVLVSGYPNDDDDNYVLTVVVKDSRDFTTLQLCEAVSKAVVTFTPLPEDMVEGSSWKTWKSGRFTKILKRLKEKDFVNLPESLRNSGVSFFEYRFGNIDLVVVEPVRKSFRDDVLKRAQVSGLQVLPDEGMSVSLFGRVTVVVNKDLDMGPSKAAIASAHALQIWRDNLHVHNPLQLQIWNRTKPVSVLWKSLGVVSDEGNIVQLDRTFLNPRFEEGLIKMYPVLVRDAGLTEVVPGSITAAAKHSDFMLR